MFKNIEVGQEKFYEVVFNNALAGMCISNQHRKFVTVNDSFCKLLGYKKEELLKLSFLDITHPLDLEKSLQVSEKIHKNKIDNEQLQKRYIHKGGHIVWAITTLSKIKDSNFVLTQIQDITEQKRYEQQLSNQENVHKLIVNNSTDVIMRHLPNSRAFFISSSCKEMLGYNSDELLGTSPFDEKLIHKDDIPLTIQSYKDLMETKKMLKLRYRIKNKHGQYIWVETTVKGIYDENTGELQELISVSRECTDQVQSEISVKKSRQQLKETHEKMKRILDGITDGLLLLNKNGLLTFVNEKAEQIFEINKNRLIGKSINDIINRFNLTECENPFYNAINIEKPEQVEVYFSPQNKWLEIRFFPSTDGMAIYVSDITERKDMEEMLVESEELYRTIVECSSEAIGIHREGKFLFVNKAFIQQAGASTSEEIIGKDVTDLMLPEGQQLFKERYKLLRLSLNKELGVASYKIKRLDGVIRDYETTAVKVKYKNQEAFQFIARDVTEDKRYKEFLVKSDKLNLVGELAAGVAHEIRNPLTTIKGFIHLLQTSSNKSNHDYFDLINSEFDRVESIIYEFLTLAKPHSEFKLKKQNINMILKDVVALEQTNAILKNALLSIDVPIKEYYLKCDIGSIKQVFINIIQNAIDAVDKTGEIKVCMSEEDNRFVCIEVVDNGCGIPEDRMYRLGEPFYTLKEKGTGLGLMVSYKILENHGGTIDIKSKEGEGTKVQIRLPLG